MNLLRREFLRELIGLAVPITISQVGYVLVGMTDTFFLGRMGITPLALGTLAIQYHVVFLVLVLGISYALTPLITDSFGEKESGRKISSYFKHTFLTSLMNSLILFPLSLILFPFFGKWFQVEEEILRPAMIFHFLLSLSLLPLSVFTTCRMLFEAHGNSRAGMRISIQGNVLNILLNVVFVYFTFKSSYLRCYSPALATLMARSWMAYVFWKKMKKEYAFLDVAGFQGFFSCISTEICLKIARLGIPVALQFFFEVMAFTAAGFLAAGFGKIAVDGHAIALQLASFTYMFGSGISNAACVLSGKYQNDPQRRRLSFEVPVRLILIITLFFSLLLVLFHRHLPYVFTEHEEVTQLASELILFAAVFQVADGMQVVCAGILRGIQDVRYPTRVIAWSYVFLGILGAYGLGSVFNMHAHGIWMALSISLFIVAVLLFFRCRKIYQPL